MGGEAGSVSGGSCAVSVGDLFYSSHPLGLQLVTGASGGQVTLFVCPAGPSSTAFVGNFSRDFVERSIAKRWWERVG